MKTKTVIDETIEQLKNLEAFKIWIEEKLKNDHLFLKKVHWHYGKHITLLDVLVNAHGNLIQNHSEKGLNESEEDHKIERADYSKHIQFLLEKGADRNLNCPIHQALRQGKKDLVLILLGKKGKDEQNQNKIDMGYDAHGSSLLKLAIESRDVDILKAILDNKPKIDRPYGLLMVRDPDLSERILGLANDERYVSKYLSKTPSVYPLHHAIINDFKGAVPLLVDKGAKCDAQYGKHGYTPLALAARKGRIDIIQTMFDDQYADKFKPSLQEKSYANPVNLLCARLKVSKKAEVKQDMLRGIAVLIAHGARIPDERYIPLIHKHRDGLLEAIKTYTKNKPELVQNIAKALKDNTSVLHQSVFDTNKLTSAFRFFIGKADRTAFSYWQLISKAQDNSEDKNTDKFSQFVTQYEERFKNEGRNRWSGMLWKLSRGEITTWEGVQAYANTKKEQGKKSLTAEIVNDMLSLETGDIVNDMQILNN